MHDNKLIPLCRLYENISKTTGKRYFAGTLSFTARLLLFQNDDAAEGEPQWTLFLAERPAKDTKLTTVPQPDPDGVPEPDWPVVRRRQGF